MHLGLLMYGMIDAIGGIARGGPSWGVPDARRHGVQRGHARLPQLLGGWGRGKSSARRMVVWCCTCSRVLYRLYRGIPWERPPPSMTTPPLPPRKKKTPEYETVAQELLSSRRVLRFLFVCLFVYDERASRPNLLLLLYVLLYHHLVVVELFFFSVCSVSFCFVCLLFLLPMICNTHTYFTQGNLVVTGICEHFFFFFRPPENCCTAIHLYYLSVLPPRVANRITAALVSSFRRATTNRRFIDNLYTLFN